MADITKYLALNYLEPKARKKIEELNLANLKLTGELDFTGLGFDNLKRLDLSNNNLTKLTLLNPQQLIYLDISNNQLKELDADNLNNLVFGQINKNPLPEQTRRAFLIKRWNYYKQVEKHHSDLLSPDIMKLVDISDLDNFIDNYDFEEEGSADYHSLIGNSYTYLDEYALEQLSQTVLARALIKQNELVEGENSQYEGEINNYARQFQKVNSMYIQFDLALIQREVLRKIAGKDDPAATFQKKLFELEKAFKPIRESINLGQKPSLPSVENIKDKITELQEITQQQKEDISQLWKSLKNTEAQRRTLEENNRLSETEKKQIRTNLTNSQQANENLSQRLTKFATNEQNYRVKIQELEAEMEELVDNHSSEIDNLKDNFAKLLTEKDDYISQLETTIKELKITKSKTKNIETQTEQELKNTPTTNYWKWGLIGLAILVVAGLGWWGWKKMRY